MFKSGHKWESNPRSSALADTLTTRPIRRFMAVYLSKHVSLAFLIIIIIIVIIIIIIIIIIMILFL